MRWKDCLELLGFSVILITGLTHCEKVPFGNVGIELGDYRLMNGEPFVSLFEHENYRGESS
jgi:hypothetical protein